MEAAKKRKMNWSANEINALVDGFVEYQEVLEGKLSNQLTSKVKLELYENLTESINSQSLTQRSVEEVKKKLSDIKTDVRQLERKRLREARATGGGPAIADLKDWQEKLLSALPKVSIEGFPGIDNFKVQTTFNAEDKELSEDEERILAVEEQKLALKEQKLEIMRQQLQVQADIRDELHNINSFISSISNVTTLASCNP
ncbi:hypothetical protein DPMN_072981 [Dreissena polymorpha]|uniref:Myb/SANT-like DNA-binding domain-containing protein n=1 Tax=Dreissena polymorpha TaxID=45954 RepID=A0A9D4BY81_DREPO|nr:hypothetical protein DPMN_072981 [Dreissena polymorpha]